MITQHNVLLTEMLFLGSMLMIIIVTNLAQRHYLEPVLPVILCQSYLQIYFLGKGLIELLQHWGILLPILN